MKRFISVLGLWLCGVFVAGAQVEQGAYLVSIEPAKRADGVEMQPYSSLVIARAHDAIGTRQVDFYFGTGKAPGQLSVGDGAFQRTEIYRGYREEWNGGKAPPPQMLEEINARQLPLMTSGRIDAAKLEGEYGAYWFWWKDDKFDRAELVKHKFHGERIGVESVFVADGSSEPITEIAYDKPFRVRVKFDRDIPANARPHYFTFVYLWQNRQRDNSLDSDSRVVTFKPEGPRAAMSEQDFVFKVPASNGVSIAKWERPDHWRLFAPAFSAVQLLEANGTYRALRVVPPPQPAPIAGKAPPLEELERPVVRVQATGTTPSVGPGLEAVVENQPFDIHVFVPASSLPKLANGRTPDPKKVPESITVKIAKEDDGETTLSLRYKGGCLYSTASPITAKDGGGGAAEVAGFDFSTVLGSSRLAGGIGSIDVPEGGKVTVSYQGEEANFTVHESGTRLALALYRASFVALKADAEHKLRSGGLSEIEQLALVSPDVSEAVRNFLRARTLTDLERVALERTVRACDHAFTLIDGDYYKLALTKLLIAENYAAMMRAGMGDTLEDGNRNPDSPSRFGFNYINDREAGVVTRAINQAREARSDVLVRLARDVAVGFYQWTLSLTWAGDAVAIGGINPVTGKPMTRAERIMAVVNAASGLATQAATTAVTKNAMGETVLEFVVNPGSPSKPVPIAARPSGRNPASGAVAAHDDLLPVRFDNIPAATTPRPFSNPAGDNSPTARINPPADNTPTVRIAPPGDNSPTVRTGPAGDNSPTVRINPPADNSPTVRINPPADNSPTVRINPPADNTPTVRISPPGDNSPTMIARPNTPANNTPTVRTEPAGNNSPTVRINPPADNSPTVRINPPADNSPTVRINPAADNTPTVRINPPGDNSPTVITRPNTAADNTPTVRINPPADNSPTIITRPGPAGDNSPTLITRPNSPGDNNPTVINRPNTPVPSRQARPAKPVPPPPAPITPTAERAAARRNRPALTESGRASHAARNDAALAAGRADGQARGRAARDRSLELLRSGKELDDKNTLGLREDLAALGLQESLEARVKEARRAGVREDDIATAIKGVESPGRTPVTTRESALRNLETEIVEARGYTIIGSDEAVRISGTVTRASTGNFTPADREFVRARVAEARTQGRDWFEDVGRQGTMNYHDGFLPVANTQAVAALRKLLEK